MAMPATPRMGAADVFNALGQTFTYSQIKQTIPIPGLRKMNKLHTGLCLDTFYG